MQYVTHRSRWMETHNFVVMCHNAVFVETVVVPTEHEK
jgi:hypothetical protein